MDETRTSKALAVFKETMDKLRKRQNAILKSFSKRSDAEKMKDTRKSIGV